MKLHQLPPTVLKSKRRLGRGEGSGRSKTSGRGTKGQNARGTMRTGFEGGQLPLIKRLPLYRGKLRNPTISPKALVINLKVLNILPKDTIVNRETLIKHRILPKEALKSYVKILGDGELTIPLTIALPLSKQAAKKVTSAGGKIEKEDASKKPTVKSKE